MESLETYNIFEYLQDEETFEEREETNFSNEKDNCFFNDFDVGLEPPVYRFARTFVAMLQNANY